MIYYFYEFLKSENGSKKCKQTDAQEA